MIPNLKFPDDPFIFRYIKYDYNQAVTDEDFVNLFYKWDKEVDNPNEVRAMAYKAAQSALYSEITKKSYDTKQFEQC